MYDKRGSTQYDTQLLNESMVSHLFLASIPQLIIKTYNNAVISKEDVSPAYTLSVVMSAIYIAVGLYRYVYHVFIEKTTWSQLSFMSRYKYTIPFGGKNESLGIPRGSYDVRRNKEIRDQDRMTWERLLVHHEVEEALMLSEQLVSRCFLNEVDFLRVRSVLNGSDNVHE